MFHTLQLPKKQCKDTRRQTRPGHFVHGVQFQGLLKILLGIPLAIGSGKLEPASSILFLSVGPAGELQSFKMIHTSHRHSSDEKQAHLIPSQASIPAEFGFYNSATAEINGPSWFQFQSCSVIIHGLGRAIHQNMYGYGGNKTISTTAKSQLLAGAKLFWRRRVRPVLLHFSRGAARGRAPVSFQ